MASLKGISALLTKPRYRPRQGVENEEEYAPMNGKLQGFPGKPLLCTYPLGLKFKVVNAPVPRDSDL